MVVQHPNPWQAQSNSSRLIISWLDFCCFRSIPGAARRSNFSSRRRGQIHATRCSMLAHPGHQRRARREVAGPDQEGHDRQTRRPDPPGREGRRADRLPAGDFLRTLLLRRAKHPLVRLDRAGSRRAHDPAHAVAGEGTGHRAHRSRFTKSRTKASTTTPPR